MSSLLTRSVTVLALAVLLNIAGSYFAPVIHSLYSPTPVEFSNSSANATVVKLYGSAMSTCTRRVATVLKEKNVPYELIPINFSKREHKDPHYIETKQPFGQVPVLQDGDLLLYESRAISRYIALKYFHQGTPLLPSHNDIQAFAKFEQAASVEQNNFDPFASASASELVFKPTKDEKRVEELRATLQQKLEGYERILSKQKYLAGEDFTLADLFHLPYGTMITEQLGIDLLLSRPNVARWWADISSRPTWLAVKNGA